MQRVIHKELKQAAKPTIRYVCNILQTQGCIAHLGGLSIMGNPFFLPHYLHIATPTLSGKPRTKYYKRQVKSWLPEEVDKKSNKSLGT